MPARAPMPQRVTSMSAREASRPTGRRRPRGARPVALVLAFGASVAGICAGRSSSAVAFVAQPCCRRRRARRAGPTSHVHSSEDHPSCLARTRRSHFATRTLLCASNGCGDRQSPRSTTSNSSARIDNVRRIFAISDLHTDSAANMQWLIDRCTAGRANAADENASHLTPGPNDALIIAGDISHDLDVIHDTLSTITTNLQSHTFFIPGNHEAWIGGSKMDDMGLTDSFTKLEKVVQVCDALGVHTSGMLVGCSDGNNDDPYYRHPVWIVPMWSWYDGTLALPDCEDLSAGLTYWPWVDFKRCEWGNEYEGARMHVAVDGGKVDARFNVPGCERVPSQVLTKLFLSWNEDSLNAVKESSVANVISFSHFLPSPQTLPDWKVPSSNTFRREEWLDHPVPDVSAKFAYVAGSELIDEQIRSISPEQFDCIDSIGNIRSQIHVFGHSHRPKDFARNGIRYVHNPVGKPVEREMNMINGKFDFQLIWNCTGSRSCRDDDADKDGGGEVKAEDTIIRYWEQFGGGVDLLAENMAKRRRRKRSNR